MKDKIFKGRKDYKWRDLKAKFGFKPLVERRALLVSLGGMEPTKFDSMRKSTKTIGAGEGVIRYVRNKGRDFVKKFEDENFKGVLHKVVSIQIVVQTFKYKSDRRRDMKLQMHKKLHNKFSGSTPLKEL